jgi:hypothetical protein
MLNVFALASQRKVPVERKRRMGRDAGYGAIAYADIVVRRTRTDSRGLESSRYVHIVGDVATAFRCMDVCSDCVV